jgi:hypothetical protein
VSYLITEKEMEKLCSAEQTEDTDVETRDVLVCPKCKRLAIQAKPDSVIYEFFESQAGREKDDG